MAKRERPSRPRKRKVQAPVQSVGQRARDLEKAMRRVVGLQNRRRALDREVSKVTEQIRTARLMLRSMLADETDRGEGNVGDLPTVQP